MLVHVQIPVPKATGRKTVKCSHQHVPPVHIFPFHKSGFSQDSPQQVTQGKVETIAFLPQAQREALQPRRQQGGEQNLPVLALSYCLVLFSWGLCLAALTSSPPLPRYGAHKVIQQDYHIKA